MLEGTRESIPVGWVHGIHLGHFTIASQGLYDNRAQDNRGEVGMTEESGSMTQRSQCSVHQNR